MKELGSEVAQQPERLCNNLEVSNRTNQFQTQDFVTDRGRPVVGCYHVITVHNGRITSRSLGDRCKFFSRRDMFLQREREQSVIETSVIQARSSGDSESLDVELAHDRSGQPVVETSKTQTLSSGDSGSLDVELAHDRSGLPAVETNTENVPDSCSNTFCVMKA